MTGLTYLWPDDEPFDPQPEEYSCPATGCGYAELRGLTPDQRARLERLRQMVLR